MLAWIDTGSRWKPSYILGGLVGVSKTFQILYRKEDIELYDVFTFKVYMVVDINKVFLRLSLSLSAVCNVELMFLFVMKFGSGKAPSQNLPH